MTNSDLPEISDPRNLVNIPTELMARTQKSAPQEPANQVDDFIKYRLDHQDKRTEALEEKFTKIDERLTSIQVSIAGLPTRSALWGMVATVIAVSIAIVSLIVAILTYLQAFRLH